MKKKIEVPAVTEWSYEFFTAKDILGLGVVPGERVVCTHPSGQLVDSYVFDGTKWHSRPLAAPLPEPVRVAAEREFWAKKTPGEGEFRAKDGALYQFRNATFAGMEQRYFYGSWGAWEMARLDFWRANRPLVLAWHRKHYVLQDDEAYGPDGPFKMREDQVRDGEGNALVMQRGPTAESVEMPHHNTGGRDGRGFYFGPGIVESTLPNTNPSHPANIPSQRARIEAFLEREREEVRSITAHDGETVTLRRHCPTRALLRIDRGNSVSVAGELSPASLRALSRDAARLADEIEGTSKSEEKNPVLLGRVTEAGRNFGEVFGRGPEERDKLVIAVPNASDMLGRRVRIEALP